MASSLKPLVHTGLAISIHFHPIAVLHSHILYLNLRAPATGISVFLAGRALDGGVCSLLVALANLLLFGSMVWRLPEFPGLDISCKIGTMGALYKTLLKPQHQVGLLSYLTSTVRLSINRTTSLPCHSRTLPRYLRSIYQVNHPFVFLSLVWTVIQDCFLTFPTSPTFISYTTYSLISTPLKPSRCSQKSTSSPRCARQPSLLQHSPILQALRP